MWDPFATLLSRPTGNCWRAPEPIKRLGPDGTTIAICADDQRVAFWNVASGVPIVRQQYEVIIYDIAASRMGAITATVGEDRFVRIWNRNIPSAPLVGHLGKVTAIAISAKETRLPRAGSTGPSLRGI